VSGFPFVINSLRHCYKREQSRKSLIMLDTGKSDCYLKVRTGFIRSKTATRVRFGLMAYHNVQLYITIIIHLLVHIVKGSRTRGYVGLAGEGARGCAQTPAALGAASLL